MRLRARDMRIDYVLQGVANKRKALEEILAQENLHRDEVAFVGDDIVDLPIMRECGLTFAVADARANRKRRGTRHHRTCRRLRSGAGRGGVHPAGHRTNCNK